MRKFLIPLAAFALAAAVPFLAQRQSTSTIIYTSKGHALGGRPAVSRDGQRIYFVGEKSLEVFMYDRATRREVRVLVGKAMGLDISPAGDRMLFSRGAEGGEGSFIWTVALDPATGMAVGSPRRVSLTKGGNGSLSPDGRLIAFAAWQGEDRLKNDLVVVPTAGGPERVVTSTRGAIWPVQWMPNAASIYYGLSESDRSTEKSGMYRIPAEGGVPQLIVQTEIWEAKPGLSPDGRVLMVWNPGSDSILVTSADGRRINARGPIPGTLLDPQWDPWPDQWLGSDRGLRSKSVRPRIVSLRSLVNGRVQVLTDSTQDTFGSFWSPDGRQVAVSGTPPTDIMLANADGSGRRVLRTKYRVYQNRGVYWSPDGRSIAYRAGVNGQTLGIIDIATGTERADFATIGLGVPMRWRSDSRAILYTTSDSVRARDSTLSVSFRERTIAGVDRVLRTIRLNCTGAGVYGIQGNCTAAIVSDSVLVAWGASLLEFRAYNLRTADSARAVYTKPGPGPGLAFSTDGRWMLTGRQMPNGESRLVDVVSIDGANTRTLTLPFAIYPDAFAHWISSDGRELILASGSASDEMITFHRVDVASGTTTRLTSVSKTNRSRFDHVVSADGRSLATAVMGTPYVTFYEVDVSALLRGGTGTQRR